MAPTGVDDHAPVFSGVMAIHPPRLSAEIRSRYASPGPRTITGTDLMAGVPAVIIAVLGLVSLAFAHAHHHTLTGVLSVSIIAVLAMAGMALVWAYVRGVAFEADLKGMLVVLGGAVLAGVMFLPGFSYGVSDKDPGGYVAHAVEIAHHHSYSFTDPALAHRNLPVALDSPGARLPGVWVRDDQSGLIVPQFYHLWPSLLATSFDLAGYGGITATGPIVALIGVMVLIALLRRLVGIPAAAVGGALLSTNMLQVWQAKFPTTEVLAQEFFLTSLLGIVIALQTKLRTPAFIAGAVLGISFLNRADSWLLVMFSVGALASLWVLRRWDARVRWFAVGLGAVMPYALWNAYAASISYTKANSIPSLKKTVEIVVALAILAALLRLPTKRLAEWVSRTVRRRAIQSIGGLFVTIVVIGLLVLGFKRPSLLGKDYGDFNGRTLRTYDEQIMHRLAWFVTAPGFALMALGVAVATLRRWRAEMWAVLLPILVIFPLFAAQARNSTRLMWWGRRYVPVVLPGIILLIAIGLGVAIAYRGKFKWLLRIPALVAAVALVTVFLGQSRPLRHHDEWAGSFGVARHIASLSNGKTGVYLWERAPYCCAAPTSLFATPVWLERDQLSVLLPTDPTTLASYVDAYLGAFPNQPIFIMWTGALPADSPLMAVVDKVEELKGSLPVWEESDLERPHFARAINYSMTVYKVSGT